MAQPAQPQIDLNCDYGESFGGSLVRDDVTLLHAVTSVNIACGAHSGDPDVMRRSIVEARDQGVSIGAHPGFPDLTGFGRRVLQMSPDEMTNSVLAQLGALAALAQAEGLRLSHVKAHGALYHQAARMPHAAAAIATAVAAFDSRLILMGLAGSAQMEAAQSAGLRVAREAFADRVYEADGTLRSRRLPGAIIHDNEQALQQAIQIARDGVVLAYDGSRVPLQADSICLHGDTPGASTRAAHLRAGLQAAGVAVVALPQVVRNDA